MDEIEPQETSVNDSSIEIKAEDLNKDELNINSNDQVVLGDVGLENETQDLNPTNNLIKSADTSNGITALAGQEAIGDKEFEPIYDE